VGCGTTGELSVSYGQGKFLFCCSSQGKCGVTTDFTTFVTNPSPKSARAVEFCPNQNIFFASGTDTITLLSSADGVTWIPSTFNSFMTGLVARSGVSPTTTITTTTTAAATTAAATTTGTTSATTAFTTTSTTASATSAATTFTSSGSVPTSTSSLSTTLSATAPPTTTPTASTAVAFTTSTSTSTSQPITTAASGTSAPATFANSLLAAGDSCSLDKLDCVRTGTIPSFNWPICSVQSAGNACILQLDLNNLCYVQGLAISQANCVSNGTMTSDYTATNCMARQCDPNSCPAWNPGCCPGPACSTTAQNPFQGENILSKCFVNSFKALIGFATPAKRCRQISIANFCCVPWGRLCPVQHSIRPGSLQCRFQQMGSFMLRAPYSRSLMPTQS
jgi:hypothetical protein